MANDQRGGANVKECLCCGVGVEGKTLLCVECYRAQRHHGGETMTYCKVHGRKTDPRMVGS